VGILAKDKKEKKGEQPPVDGAEGAEGEGAPKKKGLPIMLIAIAGGAVLLLGGGGAAAWFLFLAPKPEAAAAADGHGAPAADGHGAPAAGGHGAKPEKGGGGHGGGGSDKVDPKTQPVIADGPNGVTYFTMPYVLSNIESADGRTAYLKLKLTFECSDHAVAEQLTSEMPRINDILQGFIRELRPEDLAGSEGNYQLRLEILRRINLILAPAKINAVLIEEMLIT
jgi:flagellar protein FliL